MAGWRKIDTLASLLLVALCFFAWRGILHQTIEGEGYYYFSPSLSFVSPQGKIASLWGYDNFPVFATYILERLFKGDMLLYMGLEFITVQFLAIAVYIFIKKITNKSLIAFLSAVLICVNFPGLFQLLGRGHYAWYLQRIPQIFLMLPSWWFFYSYLQKGGVKKYLLSLILFSLGILSNHYTSLYTSFYPALLVSHFLFAQKGNVTKKIISNLALLAPFLIANAIIISKTPLGVSNYRPGDGPLHFILNPQNWLDQLLYHMTVITFPTNIFLSFYRKSIELPTLIRSLIIPVFGFYAIALLYLYNAAKKFFVFIFAVFLALLSVVFLNIFLNQFDIYTEILQGRYFFIPTFYGGIIFASFFGTLFSRNKNLFIKISLLALLFVWLNTNIKTISQKMAASQPTYDKITAGLNFLNKIKPALPDNAIVVLPSPLMPIGGDFYAKFYAPKNTVFYYLDSKWQENIPANYPIEKIFVYEFDKNRKNELVDKSQIYRANMPKTYGTVKD